jgi:hypothetical protein
VGEVGLKAGQPDLGQILVGDGLAVPAADAAHLEAERRIREDRVPWEQDEILEDDRPVGSGAGDLATFDPDRPGCRPQQPRDELEERGLAAPARSEQGHELTDLGEPQGHISQGLEPAAIASGVLHAEPVEVDHGAASVW